MITQDQKSKKSAKHEPTHQHMTMPLGRKNTECIALSFRIKVVYLWYDSIECQKHA